MWLILGLLWSCFANEDVMNGPAGSLDYNADKLPPQLQKLYHQYYAVRDDLLHTKHSPPFVVINLDGNITQFYELGDAIWQSDYPNGLMFALGSEDAYRVELFTMQLGNSGEVPHAHPLEMQAVECAELKLQRGVHGDRWLFITLPHSISASSNSCFPVNHVIATQSPINSVQDSHWQVMKSRGFPTKYHPQFGEVVYSFVGGERHAFLSSTEASKLSSSSHANPHVSLLGHSLLASRELRLEVAGWRCPPVAVAAAWQFEEDPCSLHREEL